MNKMEIARSKGYFLPSIFRNREKITLVLGRWVHIILWLNILFVSEENGHLNVGLEDLVEEPLDAGED